MPGRIDTHAKQAPKKKLYMSLLIVPFSFAYCEYGNHTAKIMKRAIGRILLLEFVLFINLSPEKTLKSSSYICA